MNIVKIYAKPDGTIVHIWDSEVVATPDTNTTLVVEFDAEAYDTERWHLSDNVAKLLWDGSNLLIDDQVYRDATWINARNTEIETVRNEVQADNTRIEELLASAGTAVSNIDANLALLPTATNEQRLAILQDILTIQRKQVLIQAAILRRLSR